MSKMEKMGKREEQTFNKRRNKCSANIQKKISISLGIRKMQIKRMQILSYYRKSRNH